MDEDQTNEIIEKLDYLYVNSMTKTQADEMIQHLKNLATEVAELKSYVEKSCFPGS